MHLFIHAIMYIFFMNLQQCVKNILDMFGDYSNNSMSDQWEGNTSLFSNLGHLLRKFQISVFCRSCSKTQYRYLFKLNGFNVMVWPFN